LTFDASTASQPIYAIESSIAVLCHGLSLAEPDLAIFNPATWSAIRRTKDGYQRYLIADDPSDGEVSTIWGVPVMTTTQRTPGVRSSVGLQQVWPCGYQGAAIGSGGIRQQ
jgi:HK97 family phage major capsid protein